MTKQVRVAERVARVEKMMETETTGRARDLEQANRRLRSTNEELHGFAHVVSHDLGQPLRGIAGFTRIFARECGAHLDARGMGHLDRVLGAVDRMRLLVADLGEISRAARVNPHQAPFDPPKTSRQVYEVPVRVMGLAAPKERAA